MSKVFGFLESRTRVGATEQAVNRCDRSLVLPVSPVQDACRRVELAPGAFLLVCHSKVLVAMRAQVHHEFRDAAWGGKEFRDDPARPFRTPLEQDLVGGMGSRPGRVLGWGSAGP